MHIDSNGNKLKESDRVTPIKDLVVSHFSNLWIKLNIKSLYLKQNNQSNK